MNATWGDFAGRFAPGHVFGWPGASARTLFSAADLSLRCGAALVVLPLHGRDLRPEALPPEAQRADGVIEAALASLVDVVVSLYPNWLPGAREIDSAAGAGRAAVEDIARSTASSGPLYGPLLTRIAEAAIVGRRRPNLGDVPQATIALECLKLLRAAYEVADVALILAADRVAPAELERAAGWLAEHARCAVWLAGPAVAEMRRIERIDDACLEGAPPAAPDMVMDASRPWVTPLSGRPNPYSEIEKRMEAQLLNRDWAWGRAWNAPWQAGDLHNGIRVDLMWADARCVIELDGPEHRAPMQYRADRQRDRLLQSAGFTVLRFTNEEVLEDIEHVLSFIERFLAQRRALQS